MIRRDALIQHLDTFLAVQRFHDYAPNGLQVSGGGEIARLVAAVSASQAAIDHAIAQAADALLVHHGYFWKGEAPQVIGVKRARLKSLLQADINLIAYHLPLDQHPVVGNNVLFGKELQWQNIRQSAAEEMLWLGELEEPRAARDFIDEVEKRLGRSIISAGRSRQPLRRVAWCTGAAQDYLALAATAGAQVFLTGEYAERSYHEANELGMLFLACGHHTTETFGVRALGQYLSGEFAIETTFFDEANPF